MLYKRQTSSTNLNRIPSNKVLELPRDRSYEIYRRKRTATQDSNFISNVYNDMSVSRSNAFQIKISNCKEEEPDIRINRVNTKIFDSRVITPNRIVNCSMNGSSKTKRKLDSRDLQFKRNTSEISIFKKQVDLSNILTSTHIVAAVRAKLINWMIEVIKNYPERCTDYTLYRSIIILDMYLKHNKGKPVDKESIHLIGITCMYISTKYEDIYPISLNDFVHVIGYSKYPKEHIIQAEYNILRTLSFLISFPSYGEFIDYYTGTIVSKYFNEISVDKINFLTHYVVLLNLHSPEYGEAKMDVFILSCLVFVLRYCEISPNVNNWNHMQHDEISNSRSSINDLLRIVNITMTEVDKWIVVIRANVDFFDTQCPGLQNLKKYFNRYPLKIIEKIDK